MDQSPCSQNCWLGSLAARYDMSAYILYQNQTIPEKWGGGLCKCTASTRSLRFLASAVRWHVQPRRRQDLLLRRCQPVAV